MQRRDRAPVHAGDPREATSTIAFGAWGAGLGDPATNRKVELAADAAVQNHYETAGWTITRGARRRKASYRGQRVSSSIPSVLLTRTELGATKTDPDRVLAVALPSPTLADFDHQSVVAAADPTLYRINLAP